MNIRRIWILILFVLCTIANVLNYSRHHDALCLDSKTGRWVWCWPGPHLVPTINAKTFIWEAGIIMLVFLAWTNTGKAAPPS